METGSGGKPNFARVSEINKIPKSLFILQLVIHDRQREKIHIPCLPEKGKGSSGWKNSLENRLGFQVSIERFPYQTHYYEKHALAAHASGFRIDCYPVPAFPFRAEIHGPIRLPDQCDRIIRIFRSTGHSNADRDPYSQFPADFRQVII